MKKKTLFLLVFLFVAQMATLKAYELQTHDSTKIVEEEVKEAMTKTGSPGVAVALFDGKRGYTLNFGYADQETRSPITENTIFEIASITKVFTTTALAWEVLDGKMKLTDPITNYLPIQNIKGDIDKVRLVDLATHTGSLPRDAKNPYEMDAVINFLRNWKAEYPISSKYVYSNLSFGLLGIALSNVEKETYIDVLNQIILNPLEMSSTLIRVPPDLDQNYAQGYNKNNKPTTRLKESVLGAGGHLRSTSKDMLKFLIANMGVEGPPDLIKAMKFAQQGQFKVSDTLTLALGWQLFVSNNLSFIDKNGGVEGFSSYIGFLPKYNLGIVLLFNKGKADATGVGRKILRRLADANGNNR